MVPESSVPLRIDAHQHFWLLANRSGQWPPAELAAIHRDFLPQQLAPLLKQHGIDGTVLVQSLPSVTDTLFLLALAERAPFIQAVVGWADLKSRNAVEQIALLASHRKLRGLRPMLQDLADDWIADPLLEPAIAAMQRHRLSLDALILPRHLPALLAFAQSHPNLPIVIDHAAKPPIASAEMTPWREHISRFAALPQVYCKLSGLVTEASSVWQEGDLQPYADHILDVFGASRVIWGSDWPVVNLAADYGRWLATTESLLSKLDPLQRQQVMGLNAQRFYRL
ncbi:amidohydrolase family protein [Collimonas arenae]|uniref:Amidohydrolase family protein n=1 Tax=Collimonas arenae TaxID=279058 RepID=A0A127PTH3_9BURK|nr:amidohydrolase family protein [Collimonas arenae]AMP01077.1 amidohydrolase family protein [Collimonas arenae]AMP10971.1 amidohydrolase family protein [Collimonas arenae]